MKESYQYAAAADAIDDAVAMAPTDAAANATDPLPPPACWTPLCQSSQHRVRRPTGYRDGLVLGVETVCTARIVPCT